MNEFGLFGRLGSNVVVRVIHLALCALLGLVVELAGSIVYGQPGSLEPGFKNGLRGVDSIQGVVRQSDGKLVVGCDYVGFGQPQACVVRLLPNGQQDPSFINGLGPLGSSWIGTVLPQPDDKVLVAGAFSSYNGTPRASLLRLNRDGSIDERFPTPAALQGGIGGPGIMDAIIQPDGKFLITGFFQRIGGVARTNLARLNPDGTLDESFAPALSPLFVLPLISVQGDGKILLTSDGYLADISGHPGVRLARLAPDGSYDETFRADGLADDWISAIACEPDGHILLGGSFLCRLGDDVTPFQGPARALALRLNSDGTRDPSFRSRVTSGYTWECRPLLAIFTFPRISMGFIGWAL